jgi:hypothetical protein
MSSVIVSIDIAHPPLSQEEADGLLEKELRRVRLSPSLRILRIVHGYGSGGKGGALKILTQNFAWRNRSRIISAFDCGNLSQFDSAILKLASECGCVPSSLDAGNDGVTLLWVK